MGRRSRKSKRKLNSLLLPLLLTAIMLIMSTYAWFSANRAVSIEGITAKVSAAEGLQISLDGKTWGATVTVNEDTLLAAKDFNDYILPNELHPVSTIGATSSGEIQFYDGMVSSDGKVLNSAAAATQSSFGASAAQNGKYIVFDVYLKNSSSKTVDDLLLNTGTKVQLGAQTGKEGVENTGLENSVRAAFALYPTGVAFTESQANIAAITGTPVVSIWEPNYNKHIAEVATNDTTRVPSTTSDFLTFGLINAGDGTLTGINGTADTSFMKRFTTVRTDATLTKQYYLTDVNGAVTSSSYTAGDKLQLQANKISKLRVYIWLDGQDPDCIDTASTGKYLDFVLNLAKPGDSDTPTESTGTLGSSSSTTEPTEPTEP